MFLGHFAVGLGAKKLAPRVSLGTLFIAAQLPDLVWPVFLLLGIEHVRIDPGNTAFTPLDFFDYPYTHSLLGTVIIAAVFGHVYRMITRDVKSGLVLSGAVLSHWVLDFFTHRPDLPLFFWGGPKTGLGLWESVAGTMTVELAFFSAGLAFYLRSAAPGQMVGRKFNPALVALLFLLLVSYFMNVFGPPPPGEMAIAVAGNLMWLFVLLAYRADRAGSGRSVQGAPR
jgi:hypothetical protein